MENIGHITISPPDVNRSFYHFVIEDDSIFWSMNRVKFVGDVAVKEIIRCRDEEGDFYSMSEFVDRVETRKVNARVVRNLIIAGAFDNVCGIQEPKQRFDVIVEYLELANKDWDGLEEHADKSNTFWSVLEKDVSGIGVINFKNEILSNDKTKGLFGNYKEYVDIADPDMDGQVCNFAGRIEKIDVRKSKNGKWCSLTIRNNSNSLQMNIWGSDWKTVGDGIMEYGVGAIMIVQDGKVKYDDYRKKNVIHSGTKTKFHFI
jgi:DNA polymerase III alpha subunit